MINGLPEAAACPECGLPVAASLPLGAAGSPWQRAPAGLGPALQTLDGAFFRPRAQIASLRVAPGDATLGRWFALLAAALWMGATAVVGLDAALVEASAPAQQAGTPLPVTQGHLGLLAFAPLAYPIIRLATAIEARGLRLWGRVHGRRVTRAVAATVTAHASAGWVVGAAIGLAAVALVAVLPASFRGTPVYGVGAVVGASLGAASGLIWFELYAFLAVRALGFANPAVPADAQHDSGVERQT